MAKKVVLGVRVASRAKSAPKLQGVLTKFGCSIRTRVGLHDAGDGRCSPGGLVLLETCGAAKDVAALERSLKTLAGVEVRKMVFGG